MPCSAVNEISPSGFLQSFIINPDATLSTPQETVPTDGDRPAFAVALSTGQVGVMNFSGGNGRVIPLTDDPLHFDNNASVITFPILHPGTISHPHMVLEHNGEILVPDLVSACYFVDAYQRG